MEESDFQTDQTTLQVRWSRFEHPHLEVTYKVSVGTTSGASDVQASTFVASNHTYEKTGLSLVLWQVSDWLSGTSVNGTQGHCYYL